MKTWQTIALAVGVGIAAGYVYARYRIESWPPVEPPSTGDAVQPLPPGEAAPRVTVDAEEHDFGVMDVSDKGKREFVFTNAGHGLLTLKEGASTCNCAVAAIAQSPLRPGESSKVTVQWTAKRGSTGAYQQKVTVHTNDPRRPEVVLTVKGRVLVALQAVPAEMVFNNAPHGSPARGDVRLLCSLPKPLEILGVQFLEAKTAEYFQASFEPLAPTALADHPDAQSGSLLRVTIKSGLPPKAFRQTIAVRTNVADLEIPVHGQIVGEIRVFGHPSRWDAEAGLLTLEPGDNAADTPAKLSLLGRGPHAKELRFEKLETEPAWLEVKIGERVARGDYSETPLTICIPKNSPPANYLGPERARLARVVLKTNLAAMPTLEILVRFAVIQRPHE